MVENNEINLQTVFPSAFEMDPEETANGIEKNLQNLVSNHILTEEPTKVFVSGRKGVNLFHPFFNKILEKHSLVPVSLYKISPIVIMKEFFNGTDKSILLIDKIEKEEAKNIRKLLIKSNISIFKVCGYLAKKEDINELRKQFPDTFFNFRYEVDDNTYNEVNSKLISVYQSRITLNPSVNKISAEWEEDISELIRKEILSEERTNIYVDNRIGLVLFHPFINSIILKHKLSTINLNGRTSNYSIKDVTASEKKSILLTDAIGNGNEVRKILRTSKISFSKVCGYIAKKKGIVKLQKEFPNTDFKFILEVEDDKTYKEGLWRLIPVYHSRMEPLDSDHPFQLKIPT